MGQKGAWGPCLDRSSHQLGIFVFHTVREFNTHQNDHEREHNQQVLDLAWQNGQSILGQYSGWLVSISYASKWLISQEIGDRETDTYARR